jgi:uncharacterized protein (TIGR02300 family)
VANPEWGGKHTCQHCGAKYYDLQRSPIVCPKCGTHFNPDALLRSRRACFAAPEKTAAPAAPAAAAVVSSAKEDKADSPDKAAAEDLDAAETEEDELADDQDGKLIEDVSELGEDDDDMADVVIDGDKPEDT